MSENEKTSRAVNAQKNTTVIRQLIAIIILLLIFLIIGAAYLYVMSPKQWKIEMKIKGDDEISLLQGEKYTDKGCTAKGKNKITGKEEDLEVKKKGKVNTAKPGTYSITYKASYMGIDQSVKRTVLVENNDQSAREISVYDTFDSGPDSPVIGLYGGKQITVYDAFGFKEGVVATDPQGAYITDRVSISGQVDLSVEGTQKISYSVTSGDKTTNAERTVTVKHFPEQTLSETSSGEKVIYLTFDDGPGPLTAQILSILDKYNVKATFFVTAVASESYYYLIGEEAAKGHSVGVHSYSHTYDKIYTSDQAFWDDFYKMSDIIKEQTGTAPDIMRFPGGGSNTVSKKYNQGIMTRLANEATEKGYWYYDWNVASGDAGDTKDTAKVLENMEQGALKYDRSVILCHDTHEYTMNAIEPFVQWALENGYRFDTLKNGDLIEHQNIAN